MKLWEYVKRHQHLWIIVFIFVTMVQGWMLLGSSIGIDTEDIIHLQEDFYHGWLITGRQGLVFVKLLTDTMFFNPYLSGAATLFFMMVACILWTYLFREITDKEQKGGILTFSVLLCSSVVLTEQFYFKLQSMEIAIAFCFMAISLYLCWLFVVKKRWYFGVCGLLVLILLLGMYQVMHALFIFGAIACFLLYVLERKDQSISPWRIGIVYGIIFLAGFLCNQVITGLFFSGSSYLSQQVQWFSRPITESLWDIVKYMGKVLLGTQIYYPRTYCVFCVLFLIYGLVRLKGNGRSGKILGIMAMGLLYLSPFIMNFISGGEMVNRSQLVYPFVLAFMGYILVVAVSEGKKFRYVCMGILIVLTCWLQIRYSMVLSYSNEVRYQSDVRIASSMITEISKLQDEENSYPVVFVGTHPAELNASCIKGETVGYSFFEFDTKVEPYGYWSSRRILGFMHTLGVDYLQADYDQTAQAIAASSDMPDWPAEGSIRKEEDVIIVRLSESVAE